MVDDTGNIYKINKYMCVRACMHACGRVCNDVEIDNIKWACIAYENFQNLILCGKPIFCGICETCVFKIMLLP